MLDLNKTMTLGELRNLCAFMLQEARAWGYLEPDMRSKTREQMVAFSQLWCAASQQEPTEECIRDLYNVEVDKTLVGGSYAAGPSNMEILTGRKR